MLNDGVEVPVPGCGVYQITDQEPSRASVAEALKGGYRVHRHGCGLR
jgi:diketogulonate reductase-like aldo/keto reductase